VISFSSSGTDLYGYINLNNYIVLRFHRDQIFSSNTIFFELVKILHIDWNFLLNLIILVQYNRLQRVNLSQ
jgi:hypothetical protein